MKKRACLFVLCHAPLLAISHCANANAQETFYIKPTFALSSMSDQSASITDVLLQSGNAEVALDSGFSAGIGFGYQFSEQLALELGWEYRSNDSQTSLPIETFDEGNYASSLISLNAYYHFKNSNSPWRPFVGGGLVYAQEIDIDLERDGVERSLSGSGDIGFQAMAGIAYELNSSWRASAELRYISLSGITLDAEENITVGRFDDMEYKPIDLQLSISYKF